MHPLKNTPPHSGLTWVDVARLALLGCGSESFRVLPGSRHNFHFKLTGSTHTFNFKLTFVICSRKIEHPSHPSSRLLNRQKAPRETGGAIRKESQLQPLKACKFNTNLYKRPPKTTLEDLSGAARPSSWTQGRSQERPSREYTRFRSQKGAQREVIANPNPP